MKKFYVLNINDGYKKTKTIFGHSKNVLVSKKNNKEGGQELDGSLKVSIPVLASGYCH